MKVIKYAIWAAAVIGAALVGWLGRNESAQHAPRPANVLPQAVAATQDSREQFAAPPSTRGQDSVASAAPIIAAGWGAFLRNSDDYWTFAENAHKAAKGGDAAAQWYLGVAIDECRFVYELYFLKDQPDGSVYQRTVDEAREFVMTKMVWPPVTSDQELTLLKKRCERMSEGAPMPFGYGTDWTLEAAEGGFPLALATAAKIKAEGALYDNDEASQAAAQAEARALVIEALRTRDPEVIQEIADVAVALTGKNEAEANKLRLPWLLAACLRSPNCESLGEQMKLRCKFDPQCQPYETPLDILRRVAGNDFDEVERRARELNEKIDAGTIEESDI